MADYKWKYINFWGPFLGAGIRVDRVSADFREVDVSMKLRFWNRNYVGTHYGGSLYSMADPFYMLMLMQNLGPAYIVWDKAASIRFLKPGQGRVSASFRLSEDALADIRTTLASERKVEPVFTVHIVDEQGTIIAEVQKTLYVRKDDNAGAGARTQ